MTILFRLLTSAFILIALVSCSATPITKVAMQNNNEDGFGGSGNQPFGEDGFGGSGIIANNHFGATGIIGTITAFGSIWVNGVEVEYDQTTPIKSSISKKRAKLKLGQQVSLETKPLDTGTIADNITVYYPVAGKISSLTSNGLIINNQQVYINKATLFDDDVAVKEGSYIAVNALPNLKGGWNATRINTNIEKRSFYEPEPPIDFSKTVKRLIVEETIMLHRDMMNFKTMPIRFTPLHMDSMMHLHDLKNMKENMESMKGHDMNAIKSLSESFHH